MNVMIVRALHMPHWQPHRLPVQHFKSLWISFTTLNHSVRSFIYVHFRQSSNVMELLQQTFIASENWHFAEKENYFRYQGHQYANRRICFFQYTVVLADNLLLLFLWAEPFLPNNIFILFLPFRNFIVSILRCYVLLTTALRFFLSLSHHETGISLPIFFLLNVPCISHVFSSMLTQKLGIILHLISISSLEVAEVLLIRPIQLTFYHAYRQKKWYICLRHQPTSREENDTGN